MHGEGRPSYNHTALCLAYGAPQMKASNEAAGSALFMAKESLS